MFHTENKQIRGGSRTPRPSTMEFFEVILYSQSSSNSDDGGIIEVAVLHANTFSSHDKIGSMREGKDPKDSSISHTGTFFLFPVRGI